MHSVLEGVIKNFFNYWFSSSYSSEIFSLKSRVEEIDCRLLNIRPPSFIQYSPRSIKEQANWRAKEYLYFILYYSIPLFRGIMKEEYFNNLIKLVVFLEFLLDRRICKKNLNLYQLLIQNFVSELSELYKPSIMLSGVHELLHLTEISKQFGPVNFTNCFVYEELNRKIMRMVNGKDLIGEEFIKILSTIQSLASFLNNSKTENEILNFAKKNFVIKNSNKKCFKMDGFKIINLIEAIDADKLTNIKNCFNREIHITSIFSSVIFNGIRYDNFETLNKFGDCYFVSSNNQYGCIEFFFIENSEIYVYAKRLINFNIKFYPLEFEECKCKTILCSLSKDAYFISKICLIEKVFGTQMASCENMVFLSLMKVSHLFV